MPAIPPFLARTSRAAFASRAAAARLGKHHQGSDDVLGNCNIGLQVGLTVEAKLPRVGVSSIRSLHPIAAGAYAGTHARRRRLFIAPVCRLVRHAAAVASGGTGVPLLADGGYMIGFAAGAGAAADDLHNLRIQAQHRVYGGNGAVAAERQLAVVE